MDLDQIPIYFDVVSNLDGMNVLINGDLLAITARKTLLMQLMLQLLQSMFLRTSMLSVILKG